MLRHMLRGPRDTNTHIGGTNPTSATHLGAPLWVSNNQPGSRLQQATFYTPSGTNRAPGGTASQSGTLYGLEGSVATDGQTTLSGHSYSTHSDYNANPWWQLDLLNQRDVGHLVIWPRTDTPERLADFYVVLKDTPFVGSLAQELATPGARYVRYTRSWSGVTSRRVEVNLKGRYLRLWSNVAGYMSLTEVQAYEGSGANLALGKPVTASNYAFGGTPDRAVNGVVDGNFNATQEGWHSGGGVGMYIEVDLGREYDVGRVRLWNRTDGYGSRMREYYVICSTLPLPATTNLSTVLATPGITTVYQAANPGSLAVHPMVCRARYVRAQQTINELFGVMELQVFEAPTSPVDHAHWWLKNYYGVTVTRPSEYVLNLGTDTRAWYNTVYHLNEAWRLNNGFDTDSAYALSGTTYQP